MSINNPAAETVEKPEKILLKKFLREPSDGFGSWSPWFNDSCLSLLGSKPFISGL